jgi:glycosyltransferase involved in cell wall biosynthesis
VESALAQTYPSHEVIVVNDGSTDNTEAVLRQYGDRIRHVFQQHKGLSAARNAGIREARGEVVAFLDADDRWLPEKVEKQIALLESDSGIGIVGCGSHLINEEGAIIRTSRARDYAKRSDYLKELAVRNIVSGGSGALVRKECFSRVGLFDETLTSSEDWDMWLRIGWEYRIAIVEEPLTRNMIRKGSMSASAYAERMLANDLAVINKHFKSHGASLSAYLKQKAVSYHYRSAAWAFRDTGNRKRARGCIVRSFFANPFYFLSRGANVRLLARIMIGA